MATAQLLHPVKKQKSSKAMVIFPDKIGSEEDSLVLVKRLFAISISCITYLRGLFPESSYGTRHLEDLCLKILREDKNCPGSLQVVRCEGMRLESITRCQEIKNASTLLTRKLYMVMQNLGPLPNDVTMTMKLFYYNDVTPNDYQPSGFKEGNSSDMMFEGDPVHLKVGSVSTGHHTMKVKVTTESDRTMAMDNKLMQENIMEENSMEISHEGLDCEEEEEHVEDHLGHLEFSCSQEEGIGPRKRKVSEPEMDLTANKH
ncbi:HORMA domain-containing protein 2 isoform X3 [Lissotriton helveticus]